jgi:hypothetical protein
VDFTERGLLGARRNPEGAVPPGCERSHTAEAPPARPAASQPTTPPSETFPPGSYASERNTKNLQANDPQNYRALSCVAVISAIGICWRFVSIVDRRGTLCLYARTEVVYYFFLSVVSPGGKIPSTSGGTACTLYRTPPDSCSPPPPPAPLPHLCPLALRPDETREGRRRPAPPRSIPSEGGGADLFAQTSEYSEI